MGGSKTPQPRNLGAPHLDFEMWEYLQNNSPRNGTMFPYRMLLPARGHVAGTRQPLRDAAKAYSKNTPSRVPAEIANRQHPCGFQNVKIAKKRIFFAGVFFSLSSPSCGSPGPPARFPFASRSTFILNCLHLRAGERFG